MRLRVPVVRFIGEGGDWAPRHLLRAYHGTSPSGRQRRYEATASESAHIVLCLRRTVRSAYPFGLFAALLCLRHSLPVVLRHRCHRSRTSRRLGIRRVVSGNIALAPCARCAYSGECGARPQGLPGQAPHSRESTAGGMCDDSTDLKRNRTARWPHVHDLGARRILPRAPSGPAAAPRAGDSGVRRSLGH